MGFSARIGVAGVFLVKKCNVCDFSDHYRNAGVRPSESWRKNGHTVLSVPSSRCIWSGVRLLVVLSCHTAFNFRRELGLCSLKMLTSAGIDHQRQIVTKVFSYV